VFVDYALPRREFGNVSVLPTPVFFHGMAEGSEIAVDIDRGKTLVIRNLAVSEPDERGKRKIFFELNGQPRVVKVAQKDLVPKVQSHPKAETGNPTHVGAPMPGTVIEVRVSTGQRVAKGDPLLSIEAMKMESVICAEHDGVVAEIVAPAGTQVDTSDLLLVLEPNQ